jgi:hypothetical protein
MAGCEIDCRSQHNRRNQEYGWQDAQPSAPTACRAPIV